MSTSLFQQLERLKAPQTGAIADPKRRASILFDPKEAASKDRKTIYDLGIHGLQELIVLNPQFQQFEQTLFDENTLHMERAVEVKEVNELINKNVQKFLHHLSPYFLLRPAHLCLEWLIRRFQVHDYNRDELMSLVLPYHETNAFVKVIQTFRLKSSDSDWLWLKPLQKPGKTLAKSVILNRAASDKGFFNFVCTSTLKTVEELGDHAHLLQTHLNFYASVVVGALETTSAVQEWHITTLLPSLLKGLFSNTIDFVSAAYIITARLVARTQIKPKLCNALIAKVAKVQFERLRRTSLLLLIWIMDSQKESQPSIKEQVLVHLVQQTWLVPALAALTKENVDIKPLIIPLMEQSVKAVLSNHSELKIFRHFLDTILSDIEFSSTTAQHVISSFLDCYILETENSSAALSSSIQDGDVIELPSDDEEMTAAHKANSHAWYSQNLQKLERQYPTAFDATIKESLSNPNLEGANNRRKVLKMAVGYRLQSLGGNSCDVYESLYHHTTSVRLMAIKSLLKNLKDYQRRPQNYKLLKECLADRIIDDSEEIVKEILSLSTAELLGIMETPQFVGALIDILHRIQTSPEKWIKLSRTVVKHLTCEQVIAEYDNNLIILALMPLMFPVNAEATSVKALKEIAASPVVEKTRFLKNLQVKEENFSVAEFKRAFLNVISASRDTPSVIALFESVECQGSDYFKQATQLYHFIILITACLKDTYSAQHSLQIFKQISGYTRKFPIKHLAPQESQNQIRFIPLQLFSDFLVNLTTHTNFQNLEKCSWEQQSAEELHYFFNILEFVTEKCFGKNNDSREQKEWSEIMAELFGGVLKRPSAKLEFLVNFYVYDQQSAVKDYPVLRVRAFKLTQALLKGSNKSKCNLKFVHILKMSVALLSSSQIIRLEALNTLQVILDNDLQLDETSELYVQTLLGRSEEIFMDSDQLPMALYALLKGIGENRNKAEVGIQILKKILTILKQDEALSQAVFIKKLLLMIVHVNDEEILGTLVDIACKALERTTVDNAIDILNDPFDSIYRLICERFDKEIIENVIQDCPKAWQLFENAFRKHNVFVTHAGKLKSVTCVLLEALNELAVYRIPGEYKQKFLMVIIKTLAEAENDAIFLAANKLFRKCTVDCRLLVAVIENMYKSCMESPKHQSSRKSKRETNQSPIVHVNDLSWKQGVVLMEFMENKKRLENTLALIPPLFELLNCCLAVEEQTTVEYTKQLTLSALLNACQVALEDGYELQTCLPKTTFRMDHIVQCMRASQNPQTHHNALLLLSHCAGLFPQQVLHNIVDIFTFMGSSVVRHDDAFSFHIINNIIVSVVPILVKDNSTVIPVLKVFSDIILDVPEHRRLPLYTKLLSTLGAEEYLWMFLCVVLESHVIADEKKQLLQKKSGKSNSPANTDQVAKRVEIVLELSGTFSPEIILKTSLQLIRYMQQLPMQKDDKAARKSLGNAENTETSLFDVNARTAKQLRHYKYVIMQFLSAVTSSHEFLRKIGLLNEEEVNEIKPYYQNIIIGILSFVPVVSAAIEKSEEVSKQKFWKVILHHLHDVLDNTISLLSAQMFLAVVNGLMRHQLLSVRKKVIELLIHKLQQKDNFFDNVDDKSINSLLKPLSDIAGSILEKNESLETSQQNEMVFLQQTALIAIKLLSKLYALKHQTEFKEILMTLTRITKERSTISKIVLATVVLTMIEISSNLKAHSIAYLPKFMPKLVDVLQDQAELVRQHAPDNVCVAIVTGMQKLFEALPLFLGPYIVDIIAALSCIGTRITAQNNEKDQRSVTALQKINAIWLKISKDVPLRILVPSCSRAYSKLMESANYRDIQVLMNLLNQAVKNAENKDLTMVHVDLTTLFMQALEFRQKMKKTTLELESVQNIETAIIEAFVSWVLKLSESSFRPLYHKLYDVFLQQNRSRESSLTYFLLTHKIAESLKSLFVLFASNFIEDTARLLNEHNASKVEIPADEADLTTQLLKAILNTLYNIFLYDSKEFVNAQRFEYLMPAIVAQLENPLVLQHEELQQILSNCIAQLAVNVSNDVLWKQLNYQVLLKTRTSVPEVRIFSFNCCVAIARKLGDDFTALLPETVPFIAELFEDENPRVEKNTRKSVQELEVILGESLQNYL